LGRKSKQPVVRRMPHDGNSPDSRITADRYELKYVLTSTLGDTLLAEIRNHLTPHTPVPVSSKDQLSSARSWEQYISTIYLDTAGYDIYRACLAGDTDEKLRIKEYRPRGTDARSEVLWIEVKKSSGSRSQKERIAVSREVIDAVLAAGNVSLDSIMKAMREHGESSRFFLQRLWRLQHQHHRPLQATATVGYRRRAWQDSTGSLRVTIDEDLRVSRPLPEGAQCFVPLVPHDVDTSGFAEHGFKLLEVKYRDSSLPDWLADCLHNLPPARLPGHPQRPFSKFLAASEAVSGTTP
jgi:hypothetical protein